MVFLAPVLNQGSAVATYLFALDLHLLDQLFRLGDDDILHVFFVYDLVELGHVVLDILESMLIQRELGLAAPDILHVDTVAVIQFLQGRHTFLGSIFRKVGDHGLLIGPSPEDELCVDMLEIFIDRINI